MRHLLAIIRQRQKKNFCRCHRLIFNLYHNLPDMPKQFNCCEMFICCREMMDKIL